MTQCQATKQLHETVQAKAKELGLEVKITGDYCFKLVKHRNFNKQILESVFLSHDVEGDKCISGQETMLNAISVQSITLIEEPQLKQIFVAFAEKLGVNPKIIEVRQTIKKMMISPLTYEHGVNSTKLDFIPDSYAEALYQKYCYDYPTSGFKKDPVKALLEVDKIIKSL
jgi:hypothetical protein